MHLWVVDTKFHAEVCRYSVCPHLVEVLGVDHIAIFNLLHMFQSYNLQLVSQWSPVAHTSLDGCWCWCWCICWCNTAAHFVCIHESSIQRSELTHFIVLRIDTHTSTPEIQCNLQIWCPCPLSPFLRSQVEMSLRLCSTPVRSLPSFIQTPVFVPFIKATFLMNQLRLSETHLSNLHCFQIFRASFWFQVFKMWDACSQYLTVAWASGNLNCTFACQKWTKSSRDCKRM